MLDAAVFARCYQLDRHSLPCLGDLSESSSLVGLAGALPPDWKEALVQTNANTAGEAGLRTDFHVCHVISSMRSIEVPGTFKAGGCIGVQRGYEPSHDTQLLP